MFAIIQPKNSVPALTGHNLPTISIMQMNAPVTYAGDWFSCTLSVVHSACQGIMTAVRYHTIKVFTTRNFV